MSDNNVFNISRIFLGGLLGLCCAIFPVSVAASAAVNMSSAQIYSTQVRSNVSFGTGTVTANLPRAANDRFYLQAANDANYRGSVVRLNTKFNVTPNGMVGGLRNMLRVNPASLAGVAVVTGLLAGVDWFIDNGQLKYRTESLNWVMPPIASPSSLYPAWRASNQQIGYMPPSGSVINPILVFTTPGASPNTASVIFCPAHNGTDFLAGFTGGWGNPTCQYSAVEPAERPSNVDEGLVSPEQIAALQFPQTMYDPNFWGLNFPLSRDVASHVPPVVPATPVSPEPDAPFLPDPLPAPAEPEPAFEPEPEPPLIEQPIPEIEPAPAPAPDGAIQETTRETVCNWSGRELVCNQQIKRQVFLDGVPVGAPEIENVQLPQSSEGLTDCAFFPTLCEWLNWTKEPLVDDVDLDNLINEFEPDDDSYSIDLGVGVCPAPVSLNIGFFDTDIELSYEPACDLMITIRPLILASAYLLAAYIYLGVFRG